MFRLGTPGRVLIQLWFCLLPIPVLHAGTPPAPMHFEPVFRVGGDPDDEDRYWLSVWTNIAVHGNGHIFVCDPGRNLLSELDETGAFVKNHLGPGQGPGEWGQITDFHLIGQDRGVLCDYQGGRARFQFLDADMRLTGTFSPQSHLKHVLNSQVSPDGSLFLGLVRDIQPQKNKLIHAWQLFDRQSQIRKTLSTLELGLETVDAKLLADHPSSRPNFIADLLKLHTAPFGLAAFSTDNQIFLAQSNVYQVTRWDAALATQHQIYQRSITPSKRSPRQLEGLAVMLKDRALETLPLDYRRVISSKDVVDGIALADMSASKPLVLGLIPLPNDGLMVVRDLDPLTGMARADLFDGHGRFLGDLSRPHFSLLSIDHRPRLQFKNGRAYAVEENDEGEVFIAVYKVHQTDSR